jgi:hypothetical protein
MIIISPARPPINTHETNPLQGQNTSRIIQLGLQDIAIQLREANMSIAEITDHLNEKYLVESPQKVNLMTVQRFLKKHMPQENNRDQRVNEDFSTNVYGELHEMLDTSNEQIELLEILSEEFKKNKKNLLDYRKDIQNNTTQIEKMLCRKQAILVQIAQIQEKVYSMQAANEIIRIALDIIKEHDKELYAKVIEEIKANPLLIAAYQRMKPVEEKRK